MTTPLWPKADLVPRSVSAWVRAASVTGGAAITGAEQVVSSSAGRWVIQYEAVRVDTPARVRLWRATIAALYGRAGLIRVSPYDFLQGPASAITIATAADAALGATSLTLVRSVGTAAPEAGMALALGERMHLILTAADLGGGSYALTITPPLRAAVPASTAADFTDPSVVCRLASDDMAALALEHWRFGEPNLTFVEAF